MSQGTRSSVTSPSPSPRLPSPSEPTAPRAGAARADGRAWPWRAALAALLAAALGLRLWGLTHGLPYAYNLDENAHFLPTAVGLFGHSWNPHYFVNPPAYTYVLHLLFAVGWGGRDAVDEAYATDPGSLFVAARAASAVLGTAAVGLTYLAGARLWGRATGLLAAAVLAVAFLPVFYGHLALNDAPTLAPIALALWGAAGVLRRGRRRDFLVAGAGLGLACATKYTGGVVLLPLLAAAALMPGRTWRGAAAGLALAAVAAVVAFAVTNPYALLDPGAFRDGLAHQRSAADDALGKLGLTETNGWRYYLWTATWGLGWVPLAAAVAGGAVAARRDPRALALLAPAPLLFVAYMGSQERFFGRWLMPVLPLACLLAAYAGAQLVGWARARSGARARVVVPLAGAAVAVALCAQGLAASVHVDRVLSRADTRNLARDWMVAHVPGGSKVVVEPGVVPDAWADDIGRVFPGAGNGRRWQKYRTSRATDGTVINVEDYERILTPALVDRYERGGFCWVVSGSTQRGRAEAEPGEVPGAVAYYRELDRRSEVAFQASPWKAGADPVAFNFDWSFDFYPRAYERPGPLVRVLRLRGGACARVS